ncbi:hypothetical protein IQ251_19055 [Saccharopolyspora sp. HNM0983]|uniref:Uncharacterized protein n=1 Tax=Saccharopolyspora montiporae TaxID=2781240 RepID=A0A929G1R5_9PSEU|nr:hypothetical protein [Saccharopolyspora sp. HNM0983]MBE9376554.1 hypothetical protein [Saccharopolyspora sp. HNM0983]
MAEKNNGRSARARCPGSPVGEGPALEWYQRSIREYFVIGVWFSVFLAGFVSLALWGFEWIYVWWMWAIVVSPIPLYSLVGRAKGFSAGAEWFAVRSETYVRLYELSEVAVHGTAGSWNLELKDKHDGWAQVSLREVQYNRDLWDLVYNGIVYSVANGASAGTQTRNVLHLLP